MQTIPKNITSKMVDALSKEPLSFWDLLLFNNPASLLNNLRIMGLTDKAVPTMENIVPVLKRVVLRDDANELNALASGFDFDSTTDNFTTNSELWVGVGLSVGDISGLYRKVYNLKN